MSRRTRREQRRNNHKAEIRWAASLHGKLVQITPPEFARTASEVRLASCLGLAFATAYGDGAMLRVFVPGGETDLGWSLLRAISWHLRKYIQEASDEEQVMARLRSELPDINMLSDSQLILCKIPHNKKELRKAIENCSNK